MRLLRLWLVLVWLAGCSWVRAEPPPPPPIAIGFYLPVIRDVPRKDVELSLRFWVDEIGTFVNLRFKPIRFYDSMADMRRGMLSGEINFMVATAMGIAQNFSASELADGFSGVKNTPDHLYLVVRRSAGIQGLTDLRTKRLALLGGDELSEIYLELLLMKAGTPSLQATLSNVVREKRSASLVHRLFFDQADAALVYRNAYEAALALNPQIGQQLQVLEAYSFKGRSPHIGLFSSSVSAHDAQAITKGALTMAGTARGRQVLDIYHAEQMTTTTVQDLEPFRDLLAQHRALKAGLTTAKKKAQ